MLDTSAPNLARAYDYLLGGGASFAADRSLAQRFTSLYPSTPDLLSFSRTFLAQSLSSLTRLGLTQFADVGSGLPTAPSTHGVVLRAVPGARVVYVDNDSEVVGHASSLVPPGVRVAEGDLAEPEALLESLRMYVDFAVPVCLILAMVLQVLDPANARAVVGVLVRALAPGSHVVITVGAGESGRLPDSLSPLGFTPDDMAAFFGGLEVLAPGLETGPVLRGIGVKRG
ncbi:MAG TPA: SAM-dependent methyltransferase [Trebonia sp.]|nr:SAM-dependent methyltransferase [Trebonia sp.]